MTQRKRSLDHSIFAAFYNLQEDENTLDDLVAAMNEINEEGENDINSCSFEEAVILKAGRALREAVNDGRLESGKSLEALAEAQEDAYRCYSFSDDILALIEKRSETVETSKLTIVGYRNALASEPSKPLPCIECNAPRSTPSPRPDLERRSRAFQ